MKKPNFIFILSDDQGAWALGCAGNNEVKTPNLDRIAKSGIRYENFFCASPVCSPARASIVTGEMPSCHGVLDWINKGNGDMTQFMETNDITGFVDYGIEYLAGHPSYVKILAENGYRCGLSGKWHLGNSDIPKEGFEKWFCLDRGGCPYMHPIFFENGDVVRPERYVTEVITEKALDYLDDFLSTDEQSFYLSVHYTAPHSDWTRENHPEHYLQMYDDCAFQSTPVLPVHKNQIGTCPVGDTEEHRRENLTGYYAAITAMDEGIGQILDKLEESGQAENTIVIFTADNGMNMGHHGIWGKGNGTYPPNLYDTSVKIPFLLSTDITKEKQIVDTALHSHCDVFHTILDLAHIANAPATYQPGKSFLPSIQDGTNTSNAPILIFDEYGIARMIRTKEHKLIVDYSTNENFFFDLQNDPEEENNLISDARYQTLIGDMKAQLEQWFTTYSTLENDARVQKVHGTGQINLTTSTQSCNGPSPYYWSKQKNLTSVK